MFLGNFVKRLGQVMDVSAIKMKYYYSRGATWTGLEKAAEVEPRIFSKPRHQQLQVQLNGGRIPLNIERYKKTISSDYRGTSLL